MQSEAIISIRGLRTGFGGTVIHDGLDLDVYRGEVLGISGLIDKPFGYDQIQRAVSDVLV